MSEVIDAERRYVRHVKFTGPGGEDIQARLVYDYCGWAYSTRDKPEI